MYRLAPAPQPLPGTQLIQRVNGDGLGDYVPTPIYWATPAGQAGIRGLGCSGSCGCSDCKTGMGFFDTGLDFTGWGPPEWAAVGLGAYMLFSTVFTTQRAARAVGRAPGRAARKISKAGRKAWAKVQ
jgi:hypothetical protein